MLYVIIASFKIAPVMKIIIDKDFIRPMISYSYCDNMQKTLTNELCNLIHFLVSRCK